MSVWDDPDLAPSTNFVKLENEGDTFEGTITSVRTKTWDDGSKCPEIQFTDAKGEEWTWSAGQTQAKLKLRELRPEAGDHIKVRYDRKEKRAGGKTLKHLDIQVTRNGSAVAASTPAPVGAGGPPPGIDANTWSTLDGPARDSIMARMFPGDEKPPF